MSQLDFIYKRHSVRSFKEEEVPLNDIKKIIKAATYAPSGKNSQNWHFVVVKNKAKIEKMAKAIEIKNEELASQIEDQDIIDNFKRYLKYATVFKNAPVTILIYTKAYPVTGLNVLKELGASSKEIHKLLRPAPGIQNIGAAIENLMLAAANMGYGTCWMTSPNYAAQEISEVIEFNKEDYFLAAITPLGIPASEVKSPPRKDLDEVMTIVE
ncbi:nitroreductase family protein [Orenia marismortui]|uniref:Nitroreductase n=1 Tax=Orenia marismortui TaxID=46469 RepID=A0A4R8GSJ5_9FIRM|nr:nitroreductase family protein [Orenia marismortui]TDX45531.1 nitroreductase [Orenia marismortui]